MYRVARLEMPIFNDIYRPLEKGRRMFFSALIALAMLIACSDTSWGRRLRQASAVLRMPRTWMGRLALSIVLIGTPIALFLIAKNESIYMAGGAMPEMIALFSTIDVAIFFDVVALMMIAAAAVRIRVIYADARIIIHRTVRLCLKAYGRVARSPRSKAPRASAHSDEPERGWLAVGFA